MIKININKQEIRIRYAHTDHFGVVYYSRYLDWLEAGRTEILREKGITYADLEKKLPFKDNTFDGVYTCHVLEHITNLIQLMSELKRVCKNNAVIKEKDIYPFKICFMKDKMVILN